jgi:hypothetical protein
MVLTPIVYNDTTTQNMKMDIQTTHTNTDHSSNTIIQKDNKPYPHLMIVIPYRKREEQLYIFTTQMPFILEPYIQNEDDIVEIVFCHQHDNRPFNRGAMKNMGYIYARDTYGEENAKKITYTFHDIDIFPYKSNVINYLIDEERKYIVKHFFGFTFALGGIVSIRGEVLSKIGGFPNIWGWGYEDNGLAMKCDIADVTIDRSNFFPIGNMKINHSYDTKTKVITNNRANFMQFVTKDCIQNITDIQYDINIPTKLINNDCLKLINERNKGNIIIHMINFTKWNVSNEYANLKQEELGNLSVVKLPQNQQALKKQLQVLKKQLKQKKMMENKMMENAKINPQQTKTVKPQLQPKPKSRNYMFRMH